MFAGSVAINSGSFAVNSGSDDVISNKRAPQSRREGSTRRVGTIGRLRFDIGKR